MSNILIRYKLSEAGQKASLLAGGDGKATQSVTLDHADPLFARALALARIDDNGNAETRIHESLRCSTVTGTYTISQSSIRQYDAPTTAGILVADEEARWQKVRDDVAAYNQADAAKMAADRAKRLAEGPETLLHRGYTDGPWSLTGEFKDDDEFAPLIQEATRIAAERNAARQAKIDADNAQFLRLKEEAEVTAAAGKKVLLDWAQAQGSALLTARIADGYEWIGLAEHEWADTQVATVNLEPAPVPDGYEHDESTDRTTPTLDEIESVREVEKLLPDCCDVELLWAKYKPETNDAEYDPDPPAPIGRCEVRVNVTVPTGKVRHYDYLPSATKTEAAS